MVGSVAYVSEPVNRSERSAHYVRLQEQRAWLESVKAVAGNLSPELAAVYNKTKRAGGWSALVKANQFLSGFMERADRLRRDSPLSARRCDFWRRELNLAGTDDELNEFCRAKARQCERLIAQRGGVAVLELLESYGISITEKQASDLLAGQRGMVLRVACERWWRRKVKPLAFRVCEQIFRELGHTRRGRGAYVSDHTLRRFIQRETRNRNLLENLDARNEFGDVYSLAELSDLGVSNPVLRRGELMVRMRGFEEWAEQAGGWVPMFYTITCPSKFHIFSGDVSNPKYNGATPREGAAYLSRLWARFRAAADRRGFEYFGFRVAEPHHDGCPHWHLLLFVRAEQVDEFTDLLRAYALAEDGDEAGAAVHRFEAVRIERERGTAAGYIAKYVSKNIDGFGVGDDWEAGDFSANTALRVRAWAACWGIRQFQQIGGPPVTVYRELRRLANRPEQLPVCDQLEKVLEPADRGDWCGYVEAMGGAVARRDSRPLRLCYFIRERLGYYGDQLRFIAGLWASFLAFPLRSRFHEWVIELKVKNMGPVARVDHSHLYPAEFFNRGAPAPHLDLCQ